jgi:hypothetical protein
MIEVIITLGVVLGFTPLPAIRTVRLAPHDRAGGVSMLGRGERTVDPA